MGKQQARYQSDRGDMTVAAWGKEELEAVVERLRVVVVRPSPDQEDRDIRLSLLCHPPLAVLRQWHRNLKLNRSFEPLPDPQSIVPCCKLSRG